MIGDYMQHLRRRGFAAGTRANTLGLLRDYCACHNVRTVRTSAIEDWLDVRHLSPKARYNYIGILTTFHAWLVETGQSQDNPALALVRPKLPRHYPRPAPSAAIEAALERAPARMRVWLCLAAYAGLRCKEIAGLHVNDVRLDLDPPVLHLRDTKGSKDRIVPIADEVVEALEWYGLPVTGLVFPALDNMGRSMKRPLTRTHVSKEINSYLHGMGIEATAHQLRHWFGTEMYRRTSDLLLVRDLMGHANVQTTSLYCALVPSERAVEAVRTLRAAPTNATKGDQRAPAGNGPDLAQPYRMGPDGWVRQAEGDEVSVGTEVSEASA